MRLALVTSIMRRWGRGYIAVHPGAKTFANRETKPQLYLAELIHSYLHWCTKGVPVCTRYMGQEVEFRWDASRASKRGGCSTLLHLTCRTRRTTNALEAALARSALVVSGS